MFILKKTFFIFFCSLFLTSPFFSDAQSIKKRKGKPDATISQEVRHQSAQFADGLRAFYSHNYSYAEEIFRNIVLNNPKSDPSYFFLSKIKLEQKEYHTAIDYIKKAIEIDPSNIWYNQFLATLYDQIEDYKNSVIIWEKVCKKVDNNEYYLYELANAYLKLERFTDVIKTYDKMEAIIGYNEDLTETKKNIWLYLNNIEKAVGEYEKLTTLYPYEIKNYITIGDIYFINEIPNKALIYYKKAELIDPDNFDVHISLYEYHSKFKNIEEKRVYFEKMVQHKESSEKFVSIIEKEIKEIKRSKDPNRLDQGIQYCELFVKTHPNNGKIWGELTQLYYLRENYSKALESADKAIQNNNISFETWNIYITLLSNNKNYQKIASLEPQITELFPTYPQLLFKVAQALHFNQEYEKAISICNNGLLYSFDDTLNSVYYELIGDSFLALNNKGEALKNWQLSIKKGNNSASIKEKINSIK